MDIDNFNNTDELNKYKGTGSTHVSTNYCILRFGKKFHTFAEVKGYENHSERKKEVLNADIERTKDNRILIGNSNVLNTVKEYLKDINKIHVNNVLAREVLLTASSQFFKGLLPQEKEKWIQKNITWLKEQYGKNIVYASLHDDETTSHITAVIVPKFYNEKKNTYVLANKRYFGSAEKLIEYQDIYGKAMSNMGLQRGIKYSKARHVSIREYYTLVNKNLDMSDLKSICAKAKQSDLLENTVLSLKNTLDLYKTINKQTDLQKANILKELEALKHDKDIFREAIKTMAIMYKINQGTIVQVLKCANEDLNKSKDNGRERELSK
jgi:hypothetical protein